MLLFTTGTANRAFQVSESVRPTIPRMRDNRREGGHALLRRPQRQIRFGLAFGAVK